MNQETQVRILCMVVGYVLGVGGFPIRHIKKLWRGGK